MLKRGKTYDEVYDSFTWNIPQRYNIANDVCDQWADDPGRIALIYEDGDKLVHTYTFADVRKYANQFANMLLECGLQRGDRVTLFLAQDPECAIAHVGCFKAGMVSSPTSVLFGPDAIVYRLNDSGAKVLVTDAANYPKVAEVRAQCPKLEHVFVIDGEPEGTSNFWTAIKDADDTFTNVDTAADDVAWISYTSGTTGMPKGSVQPHRMLLGHMPSLEFIYDFFPDDDDVFWSPADWAWMAGLADILLPAWFHGCAVVATAMKGFEPEEAYRVLDQHNVTRALLTPTMLKLMRQVPDALEHYDLKLRAALSGGEAVGKELLEWADRELHIKINEAFGQTECNVILGNNGNVFPIKPGSIGRPTPGTICAIVDDGGNELPPGEEGHIACKRPHPVMLLEYLNQPQATKEKFIGDWLITGDTGHMDEDGYFWFHGRADDVITSSGYRIGPGEIEDALLKHDAVQMVAVIGVPDPVRTEVVKAFVIPVAGVTPSEDLVDELRDSVRNRLAKHEVPRMIEFVESLPMTTTGKIMRRKLREREKQK
ncbi:MAG: AMP-dependent synthetase [Gammaproteobacteria bacterium]|nr:MAG: AMP-dependent synthetase [Gammaproteobacteria bacterium]RLA56219.1 MAG: AMP-dependent synthetase [Gammaproteobacteria bacterium]HDY82293.1 AMP-dependent synthetase [Halieaceae bacterium]